MEIYKTWIGCIFQEPWLLKSVVCRSTGHAPVFWSDQRCPNASKELVLFCPLLSSTQIGYHNTSIVIKSLTLHQGSQSCELIRSATLEEKGEICSNCSLSLLHNRFLTG